MKILVSLVAAMLLLNAAVAQQAAMVRIEDKITLDGRLEEPCWSTVPVLSGFMTNFPKDSLPARSRTEVQIACDDAYIYIGAVCHNADSTGKYIVQSLKRDFSFPVNDAFAVVFDAFSDGQNGLSFGLNPYGVQREGLVSNGGQGGVTTAWDHKWYGATQRYADRWTLEMKIPFKTLRFNGKVSEWKINFARNDVRINEVSCWSTVPRSFNIANLAFTGKLIWPAPPRRKGANIVLNPYGLYSVSDKQSDLPGAAHKLKAGIDVKAGIGNAANLDLTVMPDFSQAEVDQQVINLDRFEIYFPERRTFFLESSDLFASLGKTNMQPFFSRRIGLSEDIYGGVRFTGKLTPRWRLGLLNIQTQNDNNFTAIVSEHKLLKRSNITGFMLNKADVFNLSTERNSVGGVEFNYNSPRGKYSSKTYLHYANTAGGRQADPLSFALLNYYNIRHIYAAAEVEYIGGDYTSEMGFIPYRLIRGGSAQGYWRTKAEGIYRFFKPFKTNQYIDYLSVEFANTNYLEKQLNYVEHNMVMGPRLAFKSGGFIKLEYISEGISVSNDFTLTGTGHTVAQGYYNPQTVGFYADWGRRSRLNGLFRIQAGELFDTRRLSLRGEVYFRSIPWGVFGFTYNRQFISYADTTTPLDLVGTSIDLSFTRNIFLTTYLQYNTQTNNFNTNIRFWWRYAPMSDLYIVYSQNTTTGDFMNKDNGLVVKLNYFW